MNLQFPRLNLPEYSFLTRDEEGRPEIFDPVRKKYVALTPEEWVRQHLIQYLNREKHFPLSLMAVEQSLSVNRMPRRCDLLIYSNSGYPVMIVECKAPAVKLSQEVFDQIARYNLAFQVRYLLVSNGIRHYCCAIDHKAAVYSFLAEIPASNDIF